MAGWLRTEECRRDEIMNIGASADSWPGQLHDLVAAAAV
jgi:hypothetical protein